MFSSKKCSFPEINFKIFCSSPEIYFVQKCSFPDMLFILYHKSHTTFVTILAKVIRLFYFCKKI